MEKGKNIGDGVIDYMVKCNEVRVIVNAEYVGKNCVKLPKRFLVIV